MTDTKGNIPELKQVFLDRMLKIYTFSYFFQLCNRYIHQSIWIFLDERVGNLVQRILVRLMPYSLTFVDSGLMTKSIL